MKNIIISFLVLVLLLLGVFWGVGMLSRFDGFGITEKVYIAVEGDGVIAVVDPANKKIVKKIDLSVEQNGDKIKFSPHNVQVAPDNESVWVTANVGIHGHSFRKIPTAYAHEGGGTDLEVDQVVVIDPDTDTIKARILIAEGIGLAHVVLTPNGKFAYVTAQKEGVVYKIDAKTYQIIKEINTGPESQPHGLRIYPNGQTAYIAMLGSKSLGLLNLNFDKFSEEYLGGAAVQTGVTDDGKFAMVSLYDTKELVLFDVMTPATIETDKKMDFTYHIKLPSEAKGPIQMYPTPDSRYVYLADQGYYFNQPTGDRVYKIDLKKRKVIKEIVAGKAPHGVVVSRDGKYVYVTNLLSGDLSIIDATSDSEIGRIKVGKEPNGVSVWYRSTQ